MDFQFSPPGAKLYSPTQHDALLLSLPFVLPAGMLICKCNLMVRPFQSLSDATMMATLVPTGNPADMTEDQQYCKCQWLAQCPCTTQTTTIK